MCSWSGRERQTIHVHNITESKKDVDINNASDIRLNYPYYFFLSTISKNLSRDVRCISNRRE